MRTDLQTYFLVKDYFGKKRKSGPFIITRKGEMFLKPLTKEEAGSYIKNKHGDVDFMLGEGFENSDN